MTTVRGPFNVLNAPLGTEATVMSVGASGQLGVTVPVTAAIIASGGAIPASGFSFMQITVNGSLGYIPVYTSAV